MSRGAAMKWYWHTLGLPLGVTFHLHRHDHRVEWWGVYGVSVQIASREWFVGAVTSTPSRKGNKP